MYYPKHLLEIENHQNDYEGAYPSALKVSHPNGYCVQVSPYPNGADAFAVHAYCDKDIMTHEWSGRPVVAGLSGGAVRMFDSIEVLNEAMADGAVEAYLWVHPVVWYSVGFDLDAE